MKRAIILITKGAVLDECAMAPQDDLLDIRSRIDVRLISFVNVRGVTKITVPPKFDKFNHFSIQTVFI